MHLISNASYVIQILDIIQISRAVLNIWIVELREHKKENRFNRETVQQVSWKSIWGFF